MEISAITPSSQAFQTGPQSMPDEPTAFRIFNSSRRRFFTSLLSVGVAGLPGFSRAWAQAGGNASNFTPERFGYTGNDLSTDTRAFNAALAAAAGQTLTLRPGGSYRLGRISIASSVRIEGNGATIHLAGAGAGLYHDRNYDQFEVHGLNIIGDNNEASEQHALVFRGSSVKVGKGIISDVHTQMCLQGIDTSGFVLCNTYNTQNDLMLGTTSGRGYGQVMGDGAGTRDPSHKHAYVNVGGFRNGRHALYLGRFGNVTVTGVKVVEHAYGQRGQNHHTAVAVSRGTNAILRDVQIIRCSDEAVSIDDDGTAPGHAGNIDVEFTATDPQNDCIACRIGADGAIPGPDVGVDKVRVSGRIELNPKNTVRDVQVFAATGVSLDLVVDGARNYRGGDRKVVVNVFGDARPTYFGDIDIRLAGTISGTSDIYAFGFYKGAAQSPARVRIANGLNGSKDAPFFEATPHMKDMLVTK